MCVPTWIYVHHVHASAHEGQKRVLDAQDLELQSVVSQHVGAGNWTLGPLEEW